MIASLASIDPPLERPFTRSGMPASITDTSSCWPMTPVEATTTSSVFTGRYWDTSSAMRRAAFRPSSPVQVFALPELTIIAWARPSARCSWVTIRVWPFTLFVVYTAAAAQGTSDHIRARSFFSLFLRIPTWTPEARNPFAAVTPPRLCFIAPSLPRMQVEWTWAPLFPRSPGEYSYSERPDQPRLLPYYR